MCADQQGEHIIRTLQHIEEIKSGVVKKEFLILLAIGPLKKMLLLRALGFWTFQGQKLWLLLTD